MNRLPKMSALLVALGVSPISAQGYAWPTEVVGIEEMRPVPAMRIEVPRSRQQGDLKGPVVLKVHVGKEGTVLRAVLHESSGSPDHDGAAVRAMRYAKFTPKMRDGQPVDVTLIVPLHLSLTKQPPRP